MNDPLSRARYIHSALVKMGVPPGTAAGAVASLAGESRGFDPRARNPGDGADGSDSIGFAQWNGPRSQALHALAKAKGADPYQFETQVNHMTNELIGSHSQVLEALKAKDDPRYGADIWTRKYEIPANADVEAQKRYQNNQQLISALTGSSGDATLMGNSGEDTLAPKPDKGIFGRIFDDGSEGNYTFGDAMLGAGAALMARDNPQGAAALAAVQRTGTNKPQNKGAQDMGESQNGQYRVLRVPTGNGSFDYKYVPIPAEAQKVKEPKNITEGALKIVNEADKTAYASYDVMKEAQEIRDLIRDGKLDPSLAARSDAELKKLMDSGDPNAVNIQRLNRFINKAVNAVLLDAKGVQTEGDAQRAFKLFLDPTAQFDKSSIYDLLGRTIKENKENIERQTSRTVPLLKQYNGYDPDGYVQEQWNSRKSQAEKWLMEDEEKHKKYTPKPKAAPAQQGQSGFLGFTRSYFSK